MMSCNMYFYTFPMVVSKWLMMGVFQKTILQLSFKSFWQHTQTSGQIKYDQIMIRNKWLVLSDYHHRN